MIAFQNALPQAVTFTIGFKVVPQLSILQRAVHGGNRVPPSFGLAPCLPCSHPAPQPSLLYYLWALCPCEVYRNARGSDHSHSRCAAQIFRLYLSSNTHTLSLWNHPSELAPANRNTKGPKPWSWDSCIICLPKEEVTRHCRTKLCCEICASSRVQLCYWLQNSMLFVVICEYSDQTAHNNRAVVCVLICNIIKNFLTYEI